MSTDRFALIRMFQVRRRDAGLDEDGYRDLLEREFGTRSLKALRDDQLQRAVGLFHVKQKANFPHTRMAKALWISLANLGAVDRTDAALDTFVKRQTGKDTLAFLTPREANTVTEALKAMCAREGFIVPPPGQDAIAPRRALLEAQWRKLAAIGAVIRDYYGEAAAEELDCIPAAGSGAFIEPALVAAAHHDDAGKPERYTNGLCYGGRDVARRVDLSVMWVFELVGNVLWLRERREEKKITFREQDEIFDGQFKRYHMVRYGVDQTGMGEKVVEDAVVRHGERVVGVLFTGPNRLDMAIAMKKRFEDGTIRIEASPDVTADFRAIKKAKGTGDVVRLVNEGKVHADRFWACALACLMAGDAPLACRGYIAAPKVERFAERRGDDERGNGLEPGRMRMRADEPRRPGGRFRRGVAW